MLSGRPVITIPQIPPQQDIRLVEVDCLFVGSSRFVVSPQIKVSVAQVRKAGARRADGNRAFQNRNSVGVTALAHVRSPQVVQGARIIRGESRSLLEHLGRVGVSSPVVIEYSEPVVTG